MSKHHHQPPAPPANQFGSKDPAENMTIQTWDRAMNRALPILYIQTADFFCANSSGPDMTADELRNELRLNSDFAILTPINIHANLVSVRKQAHDVNAAKFVAGLKEALGSDDPAQAFSDFMAASFTGFGAQQEEDLLAWLDSNNTNFEEATAKLLAAL